MPNQHGEVGTLPQRAWNSVCREGEVVGSIPEHRVGDTHGGRHFLVPKLRREIDTIVNKHGKEYQIVFPAFLASSQGGEFPPLPRLA